MFAQKLNAGVCEDPSLLVVRKFMKMTLAHQIRGVFVLWICGLMNQFLKDHQLNKAEFGVTDESISVWISDPQDKNPSIVEEMYKILK